MASLVGEVKPYVPTWRPPVKVNPLIRAARWGALISGIVYGYWRHNSLKDMAQCEREDYLSRQVSRAIVKRTVYAVRIYFSAALASNRLY